MAEAINTQNSSNDPAGADRLVLATAEALVHWGENFIYALSGYRFNPDLWNGPNGARGVVEQAIRENGIPNKRFQELVNPRAVAEHMGIVNRPKRKLVKKSK